MRMRVGTSGGLDRPSRGYLELLEAHMRHGAGAEHPEEQRVEGAQMARGIGGRDGGARMASLREDKCQRVMPQRKVRAQVDGPLQFDNGLIMAAAQPESAPHRPVRGRVAIVDHEALSGGFESSVDFRLAIRPALKRILEMREGKPGIGSRERRIEPHGRLEELARPLAVGLDRKSTRLNSSHL